MRAQSSTRWLGAAAREARPPTAAQHDAAPYNAALSTATPYKAAPCNAALHHDAQHSAATFNAAPYDSAQQNAAPYNAALYDAAQRNAAPYNAAPYGTVQHNAAVGHAVHAQGSTGAPLFLPCPGAAAPSTFPHSSHLAWGWGILEPPLLTSPPLCSLTHSLLTLTLTLTHALLLSLLTSLSPLYSLAHPLTPSLSPLFSPPPGLSWDQRLRLLREWGADLGILALPSGAGASAQRPTSRQGEAAGGVAGAAKGVSTVYCLEVVCAELGPELS